MDDLPSALDGPQAPPSADKTADGTLASDRLGIVAHHHDHGGSDGGLLSAHLLHTLLRVVDVLLLALVGGWLAFRLLLAAASTRFTDDAPHSLPYKAVAAAADAGWNKLLLAALAAFLATGIGHVGMLASELDGVGAFAVLVKTHVGWTAMSRVALCVLLLGIAYARTTSRWAVSIASITLYALLSLTFPLTGHAAASDSSPSVAIAAHLLHIVASVGWFGGLIGILYASGKLSTDALTTLVRAFSLAALPLMLLVAASGLVLSGEQLDRLTDLWTTGYGVLLLGKLVIFAVVLALGAYHRWILLPRTTGNERRLITGVRIEAVAAIALFILAGWLSTTSPPLAGEEDAVGAQPFHWHVMGEVAHMTVDIPKPTTDEPTPLTADVWVPEGDLPPNAVLVTLVPPGSTGGLQYELAPAPDEEEAYAFPGYSKQHYAAPEPIVLTSRGTWNIQVVFVVPGRSALAYERSLEVP
ncbi:CopD family protein [Paenibacillus sp. TRM 82003]|nr:CopD family protein [Paenibacillus sp. TRM 82003]